jgi:ABC-type antimicrobial peptide transport system permease subunit
LFSVQRLTEMLDHQLAARHTVAVLVTGFAFLAVALAAAGLYGVMAHAMGQRTREMGIRAALGAQRNDLLGALLGDGLRLVAAGVCIGLVLAGGIAQLMRGMLAGVSATDPVALIAAITVLGGAALLACWLPARRAAKVDPVVALRAE